MPHYKDPENNVHFIESDEFVHLLPSGALQITAEEAESLQPPPPPPDPKWVGVEFDGVMCSATKEDQNGLTTVLVDYQVEGQSFQPTRFGFANGNSLTLTKDNLMPFLQVWKPFRQSFFTPEA